jgi:hypothetical protein
MTTDKRWRKSSRSGAGATDCVELPHTLDAIRDTNNRDCPLDVHRRATEELLISVQMGRFDI